ncbi:transposase [Caldiplasma sukawensis]
MEKNLNVLLKYSEYHESIRRSIYSVNIIERMNNEIRRMIRIIDSIQNKRMI